MGLPLILAGAGGIVSGLYSAASAARPFVERYLRKHQAEIEEWALANAFEAMGLPDLDKSPSRADMTAAINERLLSGSQLQLSDIFDADAIQRDALNFALTKAASDLGLAVDTNSVHGVRDALRGWVRDRVRAEIAGSGDQMISDAKADPSIEERIQWVKDRPPAPGLLMTPEAISNRERQARYRAKFGKMWVKR